jgi:hypothetical protein
VIFYDDLQALLQEAADKVDIWTGQEAWVIEPGSPASAEVANAEIRLDGSPWGERPIRSVYQLGQMATKLTAEMARCIAPLVGSARPAPGIEALTRASLESGSVVWWLLEGGLTARQRVCRMELLRRNSARELARSIAEVGEDPSIAGSETVVAIETECRDLGLAPFGQGGDELEGEVRLRYTARTKKFTDDLGYHGGYSIYSGVAHAELAGLWRLFQQTGSVFPSRDPIYAPSADPQATFAAVDGALKSMMGSMERIALLFGWPAPGRAEEVGALIDHVNNELTRLRPMGGSR